MCEIAGPFDKIRAGDQTYSQFAASDLLVRVPKNVYRFISGIAPFEDAKSGAFHRRPHFVFCRHEVDRSSRAHGNGQSGSPPGPTTTSDATNRPPGLNTRNLGIEIRLFSDVHGDILAPPDIEQSVTEGQIEGVCT